MVAVRDVYEQQKYDSFARKWKPHNFVLYSSPQTEIAPTFNPEIAAGVKGSPWVIDYAVMNVDAEGWTYSSAFHTLAGDGTGTATPLWNSKVRRRKWHHDMKLTMSSGVVKE